jgi:serine protease Do
LQVTDVILSYDGQEIHDTTQLINLVQRTKVGRKIPLRVWRAGSELVMEAVITESRAEAAEVPQTLQPKVRDMQETLEAVGLQVAELSNEDRQNGFSGVVAVQVNPGGLAADRVLPGDLIVGVNESPISNATEFYQYLSASAAVQTTSLYLLRQGQEVKIDLPGLPRK